MTTPASKSYVSRHESLAAIIGILTRHAELHPDLKKALDLAQSLDVTKRRARTNEALVKLDALAEELGCTTWTLVQYANLEGPYKRLKEYRTLQHVYEARRNLPRARGPEWLEIAQKVWAIAETSPLDLRSAVQARAKAAKSEAVPS